MPSSAAAVVSPRASAVHRLRGSADQLARGSRARQLARRRPTHATAVVGRTAETVAKLREDPGRDRWRRHRARRAAAFGASQLGHPRPAQSNLDKQTALERLHDRVAPGVLETRERLKTFIGANTICERRSRSKRRHTREPTTSTPPTERADQAATSRGLARVLGDVLTVDGEHHDQTKPTRRRRGRTWSSRRVARVARHPPIRLHLQLRELLRNGACLGVPPVAGGRSRNQPLQGTLGAGGDGQPPVPVLVPPRRHP